MVRNRLRNRGTRADTLLARANRRARADYRSRSKTIDQFVEFGDWTFNVLGRGEPHRATGGRVTANFFPMARRAAVARSSTPIGEPSPMQFPESPRRTCEMAHSHAAPPLPRRGDGRADRPPRPASRCQRFFSRFAASRSRTRARTRRFVYGPRSRGTDPMNDSDLKRRRPPCLAPAVTSSSMSARTYLPRSSPSWAARASAFASRSGGTRTVNTSVIRRCIHRGRRALKSGCADALRTRRATGYCKVPSLNGSGTATCRDRRVAPCDAV